MSATLKNLLADVVAFLKETLSSESLSANADRQRLALLLKLSSHVENTVFTPDDSAAAITCIHDSSLAVTNESTVSRRSNEYDTNVFVECYEELETNSEWSGSSSNFSRNYVNTSLYSSENRPNNHHHHQQQQQQQQQHRHRLSYSSRSDSSGSRNNNNNHKARNYCSEVLYENSYVDDNTADGCAVYNDNGMRRELTRRSGSPTNSSTKLREDSTIEISMTVLRCTAVKFGQLYRREKILFVEHTKKYWAALLGTVLYIYASEKDNRPSTVINVDDYKARPIKVSCAGNSNNINGHNNHNSAGKKDFGFEIVCPGRKTYQFYASSKTDMETWITCINHSLPIPQQMSCLPTINSVQSRYSCPNIVEANSKKFAINNGNCNASDVAATTLDRQLPSIPSPTLYEHYDKPNPVVRSIFKLPTIFVNGGKTNAHYQETFYHSIEESESRYDYPTKKECYYTCPESISSSDNGGGSVYYNTTASLYNNRQQHTNELHHRRSSDDDDNDNVANDDDERYKQHTNDKRQMEVNVCEAIYDGVPEDEKENSDDTTPVNTTPVIIPPVTTTTTTTTTTNDNNNIGGGRIQQIIQQIEEISQRNSTIGCNGVSSSSNNNNNNIINGNNKKISPVSNCQSKLISTHIASVRDDLYELVSTPSIIIKGKV